MRQGIELRSLICSKPSSWESERLSASELINEAHSSMAQDVHLCVFTGSLWRVIARHPEGQMARTNRS